MQRHGKHDALLVRSEHPFNAGPPADRLRARFLTPTELFFVRNHGEVPEVDRGAFRLRLGGEVEQPLELSLADLGAFPRRTIVATLQCAGNRRQELVRHRPIPHELPWGIEAISTAAWAGVSLADLLAAARPTPAARHVAFTGLDETERRGERFRYGGSIPLERALAPEVLLATEMSGMPLPAIHGGPLRVLVPGWIGARSVKWLAEIELRATPSDNYFQRVAYRLFPASAGPETVDWESGAMLGELPVVSLITAPEEDARLAPGPTRIEGVALSGGGREIVRVEVTGDGGASWATAALEPSSERWAWRFWRAELDLAPGERELAVRAWDAAAQTQPATIAEVWNFKGYANNAWHRVRVRVEAPPR